MKVLVACEFSGRVRSAFRANGHDAWSCDLYEPAEDGDEHHIMGNAAEVARSQPWDLMVAHPPCTHLAVSGARHFARKRQTGEQQNALGFVWSLMSAPIERIAVENPVSIISTQIRKPDQIIHPWQHGHGETKATCLWLKNLPLLTPSHVVSGRHHAVHLEPSGKDQWRNRSRTYAGIAAAMANQWGQL